MRLAKWRREPRRVEEGGDEEERRAGETRVGGGRAGLGVEEVVGVGEFVVDEGDGGGDVEGVRAEERRGEAWVRKAAGVGRALGEKGG